MWRLAGAFQRKLGINGSDLAVKPGTAEPATFSSVGRAIIHCPNAPPATNVHMRSLVFTRRMDGVDFFGRGTRGGCEIGYGNHGKICRVDVCWPKLQRFKAFPTATPGLVASWVRDGRAVPLPLPESVE